MVDFFFISIYVFFLFGGRFCTKNVSGEKEILRQVVDFFFSFPPFFFPFCSFFLGVFFFGRKPFFSSQFFILSIKNKDMYLNKKCIFECTIGEELESIA